MPPNTENENQGETMLALSMLCLVLAVLVPVIEAISWLRTGAWPGWSLADVIRTVDFTGILSEWIVAPQSWVGLHRVITDIGLPWWLVILSLAFLRKA